MIPGESVGAYNRGALARDAKAFGDAARRQSPIDLISRDAVYLPSLLDCELTVAYGNAAAQGAVLLNNGSTLRLQLSRSAMGSAADDDCRDIGGIGNRTSSSASTQLGRASLRAARSGLSQLIQSRPAICRSSLAACYPDSLWRVIKGGPLPQGHVFQLHYVDFRWGKEDDRGSEHTINSYAYSMEIQFVHWNKSICQSYEDAVERDKGIAIMAVLVQIGRLRSTSVGAIVEQLESVRYKGQRVVLPSVAPFTLASLLPDPSLRDYWTYDGSLTSSPFRENVTWIIFRYPLTLTYAQIEEFRRLKSHSRNEAPEAEDDDGFLSDNFRSPLPMNQRTVWASFQ